MPGLTVTSVTSSTEGKLTFAAPAIDASKNVLAIQIGEIYVRLTSAYTESNPLG